MCMMDEGPGMQLTQDNMRRARKDHRCGECGRAIQKGEIYRNISGLWEGEFVSEKTCGHCAIGQNLLSRECDGFVFHAVAEDLHEHIREVLPWSRLAARLYIGMRRKWKSFRGEGLLPIPVLAT